MISPDPDIGETLGPICSELDMDDEIAGDEISKTLDSMKREKDSVYDTVMIEVGTY